MMTLTNNNAVNTLQSIVTVDPKSYSKVFDPSNRNWERNPAYVMLFLKNVQNHMNDRLNAGGHVFLNDVYDALGFTRTPNGQVVGWISSGMGGAGYISFGLPDTPPYDQMLPVTSVTLEFNVDGVIFNLI